MKKRYLLVTLLVVAAALAGMAGQARPAVIQDDVGAAPGQHRLPPAPGREPGLLASYLAEALERSWPLGAFLNYAARHSWLAVGEAVVGKLRAAARLSELVDHPTP